MSSAHSGVSDNLILGGEDVVSLNLDFGAKESLLLLLRTSFMSLFAQYAEVNNANIVM